MKKLIALLLALVMVFALVACGQKEEAPAVQEEAPAASESKGTIGVVCYVTSAPYFSAGKTAAEETGAELGYEVIWTGTSEVDTAGLIACVQDLIAQGVDGICLASGDTTSMVPVCQEAMEKGIKVVSFDLDIEAEGRNAYAGIDDLAELAIPQVESIVQSIGEEGQVGVVTGVLTNELLQARIDRMYSYAAEKYPGLEFVTVEGTNEDSNAAYDAAMNIMTAYPEVDAIVSNVSTALGPICTAIEDAGMVGTVYGCGQSSPNLVKEAMANGSCVSAILWDVAAWQSYAVTVCASLIEGTEVAVGENLGLEVFPNAERVTEDIYYFYDTFTFTPENINDFDF